MNEIMFQDEMARPRRLPDGRQVSLIQSHGGWKILEWRPGADSISKRDLAVEGHGPEAVRSALNSYIG